MRILIIEDEEELAIFLQKSLRSECYEVDVAYDGELGLNMILDNHYDLIILDNILPKKTGFEICKEIRARGKTLPILILSVIIDSEFKAKMLNAGADDCVAKPYAFKELLARIKALLRRPKEIISDVLKIDDLILDSKKHSVKRGDRCIDLTRKEFMLLEYLMANESLVLSRAMILDHVWDANADLFSNTIETHIVCLRRKIDVTGSKKLIHTISGRGYKIDCRD